MSDVYPLKFTPVYKEKIWGGRSLGRLFARDLPAGRRIGESWELADLAEGASIVANGSAAGQSIATLVEQWGGDLLGRAGPTDDGRFPLLLKLLDANDVLSLQVHPDRQAAAEIGPEAVLKTECWYVIESRGGMIYKGVRPGVGPEQFRKAVGGDAADQVMRKIPVAAGDFHYLPAGTVHALGAGVVVAEVQTPSDTTYRVTDWGRGRQIHLERSMQCIRFDLVDSQPGAAGQTLLVTDHFTVSRRLARRGQAARLPPGRCAAMMVLAGRGVIACGGGAEAAVAFRAGDTLLLPAALESPACQGSEDVWYLEIVLPEAPT